VVDNNDGDIEVFTRNTMKQVRAQLHTSADNEALHAFARRDATAAARLLLTAAVQQSIDIFCTPGPQQQTRRAACGGWDRQTDRRTD